jgi:hypothetical protein
MLLFLQYYSKVTGDCPICLEDLKGDNHEKSFFERTDLYRINNCYHRFHSHCLYRYWFVELEEEIDKYGLKITFKLPEVKLCPVCRREVRNNKINHEEFIILG